MTTRRPPRRNAHPMPPDVRRRRTANGRRPRSTAPLGKVGDPTGLSTLRFARAVSCEDGPLGIRRKRAVESSQFGGLPVGALAASRYRALQWCRTRAAARVRRGWWPGAPRSRESLTMCQLEFSAMCSRAPNGNVPETTLIGSRSIARNAPYRRSLSVRGCSK